jgi:hypothetical protein
VVSREGNPKYGKNQNDIRADAKHGQLDKRVATKEPAKDRERAQAAVSGAYTVTSGTSNGGR